MPLLATFLLNLDRHPDRLQRMSDQLAAEGLEWERFPAFDGARMPDAELDRLVAPKGPIPRMTRGARACTASQIAILHRFLETDAKYALILEDDAVLAEGMGKALEALLLAGDFDILNLNRQPPRGAVKRLVVRRKPALVMAGFAIHDLVGIHYGCAGYVVSRKAAQVVLDLYARPDMPIDHIIFNPNVSKLFGRIRIQQLFPALVRPREGMVSSIQNEPVAGAGKIRRKLQRAWTETAIAPRLLLGTLIGFYMVKELGFGGARGDGKPK